MTEEEIKKMVQEKPRKELEGRTVKIVDFQMDDQELIELLTDWFKEVKKTKKSIYIREKQYPDMDEFRIYYEKGLDERFDEILFQEPISFERGFVGGPHTLLLIPKDNGRFPRASKVGKDMFAAIL